MIENDWVGLMTTQLEYYLGIDASHLSDYDWAVKIAQLDYIRKLEEGKK